MGPPTALSELLTGTNFPVGRRSLTKVPKKETSDVLPVTPHASLPIFLFISEARMRC